MMAAVSELSMYQATALRLQKEKCRRESAVTDGRNRLARREPPSEDAEVTLHTHCLTCLYIVLLFSCCSVLNCRGVNGVLVCTLVL
jgi:hypothetical protein